MSKSTIDVHRYTNKVHGYTNNINRSSKFSGGTALCDAISEEDFAKFKKLINAEKDNGKSIINTDCNNYGYKPLHVAAVIRDTKIIKDLGKVDPKVRDPEGNTPLMWAVLSSNEGTINYLIDNLGADVNTVNNKKSTPLHLAVVRCQYDVLKTLLNQGADYSAQDNKGRTPLHRAAKYGCASAVSLILSERENYNNPFRIAKVRINANPTDSIISKTDPINIKDKFDRTPLHYGALTSNPSVYEILGANGANPKALDIYGRTPEDYGSVRKGGRRIVFSSESHGSNYEYLRYNFRKLEKLGRE